MRIRFFGLFFTAVLFAAFLLPSAASAAEWQTYSRDAYIQSKSAGKIVLVAVHADWCSTCRRQLPLLESLVKEKAFENAVAYRVDFDTDKKFLSEHRVRWQSTLIVFKGEKEVGRSTADLDKNAIRKLFSRGL